MSDSIYRTYYSVETIIGMINQFHSLLNFPYETDVTTTLNTKHAVFPSVIPTSVPTIKYFTIGINGFYNVDDTTLSQPYKPSAANMDLYQPIPFRIVPIDEDISNAERVKYRLRTRITVNANEYYAYWLKLIEFPTTDLTLTQTPNNGVETAYMLNPTNLNPTPIKVDTPDIVDPYTNQVTVAASAVCNITGVEVLEAINVLYAGDVRLARISEIGLVSGEDKVVQGTDYQGNTFNYTDAVYCQLANHRCLLGINMSEPSSEHEEVISLSSGNLMIP